MTASGEDLLLPAKENTAGFIHPTEEEMNAAITKSIHNVMAVVSSPTFLAPSRANISQVRVANKFKRLALDRYKTPSNPPNTAEHVGDHLSVEHPPRSHSWNVDDRGHYQQDLNVSGINTEISLQELPHTIPADTESLADSAGLKFDQSISRQELEASCPSIDVQMVDPLIPTADPYQPPYLRIGAHMPGQTPHSAPHVCESPKATNENVYDEAYRESVEEILEERGPSPVIFSNNMVEHKK